MYFLIKEDCFCELNVSDNIISLFDFKGPIEQEEVNIIKKIKRIIKRYKKLDEEFLINEFNTGSEYKIVKVPFENAS
ncbi:hypothetical protein [Haloplasma contractile]|uniref:Uncharacterized protein n=1 Tax=Haloplasma contractile SSD-17B TaxID=1033810 RepID=U2FMC4_9MOLU|nr:hypothetical protein [Haloplasma contractile]ERJ13870.1 hypothetical protein HLPCO_000536 [Haloplasma contractile SSD-17B]